MKPLHVATPLSLAAAFIGAAGGGERARRRASGYACETQRRASRKRRDRVFGCQGPRPVQTMVAARVLASYGSPT